MKPLFCLLTLLAITAFSPLFSQPTFSLSYGAPEMTLGTDLIQTNDGGFLILGHVHLGSNNKIYVVKTNTAGSVQWADSIGNFPNPGASCVKQTSDLGYIICGQSNSAFGGNGVDGFLIKLNASGNVTWARSYGGLYSDQFSEVEQTSDGGYIVAGGCVWLNGYTPYPYVVRTNANGDTLWTKAYNPGTSGEFNSISKTMDGGFILSGKTSMNGQDGFILKTDSAGVQQWAKGFGGTNIENAACIRQTPDSGYVVCGSTMSFGAGSSDMLFVKYDKTGNLIQSRTYGTTVDDILYDVDHVSSGGYIFTGQMNGLNTALLLRTDSMGDTLWLRSYSDASTNGTHSSSVITTNSGGFAFTGHYVDQNYALFMTLVKTDPSGNISCSEDRPGLIVGNPTLNSYSLSANIIHGGLVGNLAPVMFSYVSAHDFCFTTRVDELPVQNAGIYPNPFHNHCELVTTDGGQLLVYDMFGRMVMEEQTPPGKVLINLEHFPTGVYAWMFMKDGKLISSGRVISE